ncbi:hypothetical protein CC78DRAFT_47155 [Lojkania enalia]|uniref:Uncharacterized protein n=1 Tax=Lojkania enalia TaxID=147567 RepID=A0A9P4KEK3_9PLEO|nr:hypothetical protein CC78DRAFT_47155 [Didymosphaeria enalia]
MTSLQAVASVLQLFTIPQPRPRPRPVAEVQPRNQRIWAGWGLQALCTSISRSKGRRRDEQLVQDPAVSKSLTSPKAGSLPHACRYIVQSHRPLPLSLEMGFVVKAQIPGRSTRSHTLPIADRVSGFFFLLGCVDKPVHRLLTNANLTASG